MNHRVQVLVRRAKTPQHPAKRIAGRREGLGPARSELNARDRIVSAANADAVASALIFLWLRLTVARVVALTCAHGAQL
jgi:hypothetical protein